MMLHYWNPQIPNEVDSVLEIDHVWIDATEFAGIEAVGYSF
jgi:hypothetical protein